MMNRLFAMAFLLMLSQAAYCGDPADGAVPSRPLTGDYMLYSGTLDEISPPTATDRKIAIELRGRAAKDVFDSIAPDAKAHCSSEKGERLRRRGQLWCMYSPADGYTCFIGVDLRTGQSIAGGIC
jgi:hypothetical protein